MLELLLVDDSPLAAGLVGCKWEAHEYDVPIAGVGLIVR